MIKETKNWIFKFVAGVLIVNVLWFIASVMIEKPLLPSPLMVYESIPSLMSHSMAIHALTSFIRLVEGIFLAVLFGTILGLWMSNSRIINNWLGAFVYFTYPVPKLALLPVVMLFAGIGEASKVIMIFLILIFQIIVAVRDASLRIPREMYEVYKSLGASRLKQLMGVTFPAVLPDLLTTLRVAVGTAFSVLFVAETYGTDKGMGYYIVNSWMTIEYVQMYAGIVILSMMGFVLFLLIDISEAYFCRWKNVGLLNGAKLKNGW